MERISILAAILLSLGLALTPGLPHSPRAEAPVPVPQAARAL